VETLTDLVVSEETVLEACGEVTLPEIGLIEQDWDTDPIPPDEISDRASDAIGELELAAIPDGGEVAVGVGSRGITNLSSIVRGVVEALQSRGYEPFVFPAMGSHGGATAAGQREMLAELGVDQETAGCAVRSSMEVVQVGTTADRDVPVVADANAVAADAILPVNPH